MAFVRQAGAPRFPIFDASIGTQTIGVFDQFWTHRFDTPEHRVYSASSQSFISNRLARPFNLPMGYIWMAFTGTALENYKLPIKEILLQSAIGQHYDSAPAKRSVALWVGIAVVSADWLIYLSQHSESVRLSLALVAFATSVYLSGGDLLSLGLRARPKQGWIPWIWISAKIDCVIAVCVVIGLGAWQLMGNKLRIPNADPAAGASVFTPLQAKHSTGQME